MSLCDDLRAKTKVAEQNRQDAIRKMVDKAMEVILPVLNKRADAGWYDASVSVEIPKEATDMLINQLLLEGLRISDQKYASGHPMTYTMVVSWAIPPKTLTR